MKCNCRGKIVINPTKYSHIYVKGMIIENKCDVFQYLSLLSVLIKAPSIHHDTLKF